MTLLTLLPGILSGENAARRQAEAAFQERVRLAPLAAIEQLFACLRNDGGAAAAVATPRCDSSTLQALAAVLLRRVLGNVPEETVNDESLSQIRAEILRSFAAVQDPAILRRISHLLAFAATKAPWPELLATMTQALTAGVPAQQSAALLLLSELPRCDAAVVVAHADPILKALGATLSNAAATPRLRLEAVQAAAATLEIVLDSAPKDRYASLLAPILSTLSDAIPAGVDLLLTETIQALADLAVYSAVFFKPMAGAFASAMAACAAAASPALAQLDYSTRRAALELVLCLCEGAPAVMRRTPAVGSGEVMTLCLTLLSQIDDDVSDWCAEPYQPDADVLEMDADEREEMAIVAEEAIERLVAALGVRVTLPPILAALPQLLDDTADWRRRRAGLLALGRAADGSAKALHLHVDAACNAVLQGLADPSPRVAYAACQTLGRLCDVYPAQVQEARGGAMLERLHGLLCRATQLPPKVLGHAAAGLISFCSTHCDEALVLPALPLLLEALAAPLNTASPTVATVLLQAVAALATVCETDFAPYYSAFMPGIKGILTSNQRAVAAASRDDPNADAAAKKLYGKAMEVAGLIGAAVGPEVFSEDAHFLMRLLLPALEAVAGGGSQDGLFEHVLPGAGFIARALGEGFAPYLDAVLRPLDAALRATPDFSYSVVDDLVADDSDEAVDDSGVTSAILNIPGQGKCRVTLNTHAVLERSAACRIVFELASGMGATFSSAPVAGTTQLAGQWALELLLPSCTFRFNEDVRSAASLSVGEVFCCCVQSTQNGQLPTPVLQQLLVETTAGLCAALRGDVMHDPRACAADALYKVLRAAYESGGRDAADSRCAPLVRLDAAAVEATVAAVMKVAKDSVERQLTAEREHAASETHDDEDDGALYALLEEEDDLMEHCVNAVGALIKTYGLEFLPLFQAKVEGIFAPLLRTDDTPQTMLPALRCAAICVFDDAVEHLGPEAAQRYGAALLAASLREAVCEDEDGLEHWGLRQAAVYGLGQLSAKAPHLVEASASSKIAPLLQAILEANADGEPGANPDLKENAASAIKHLLQFVLLPRTELRAEADRYAASWLSSLPMRADPQEAEHNHKQLLVWLQAANAAVFNPQTLPQVLRVVAEVLREELTDAATGQGLAQCVRDWKATLPNDVMDAAMTGLATPEREVVHSV